MSGLRDLQLIVQQIELGGPGAIMEPRESVNGIMRVLKSVTPADSGKFFRFDGNILPW